MKYLIFPEEFFIDNVMQRKAELAALFDRVNQTGMGVIVAVDDVSRFCNVLETEQIKINRLVSVQRRNCKSPCRDKTCAKHKLSIPVLKEALRRVNADLGDAILVSAYNKHFWLAKTLKINFVLFLPNNQHVLIGQKYRAVNNLSLVLAA